MRFADKYIERNKGEFFFEPTKFSPFKMIVVIPCFNEPDIVHTLSSLFDCEYPGVETGVVVVVNSTEKSSDNVLIQNRKTISDLYSLQLQFKSFIQLFIIGVENLPEKNGGVGWARKIGMDWAVSHFNHFGMDGGIIISLDADTLVEKNYLKSINNYFINNPLDVAVTISFEHRFHPCDLRNEKVEKASVYYELYMRYYRNALIYTGFPNSIYTIGSCFAVKAGAYVLQGGMNRKKAGEDFYFLHKMVMLGKIGEIKSTTVYPSSRLSDRVPFGTGPSLQKYYEGSRSVENTYPLEAFEVLKFVFSNIDKFYNYGYKLQTDILSEDATFKGFCDESKFTDEIRELINNCGSLEIFKKRFFHIFNALKVLQWLNYAAQHNFPQKILLEESRRLLKLMGIEEVKIPSDPKLILSLFRLLDKTRSNG
jgi:glycosyltransferase involved in cell wall biosynthesis